MAIRRCLPEDGLRHGAEYDQNSTGRIQRMHGHSRWFDPRAVATQTSKVDPVSCGKRVPTVIASRAGICRTALRSDLPAINLPHFMRLAAVTSRRQTQGRCGAGDYLERITAESARVAKK